MINYLYVINYAEGEEDLCKLEMKTLFCEELKQKWLISSIEVDPSRSVFIKERLTILYEDTSFSGLYEKVKEKPLAYETFKILYMRFPNQTLEYRKRLQRLNEIGFLIGGEAEMLTPKQLLGLTELDGKWFFGPLHQNENSWVSHENKPYSYSFSLGVRVSRAIANIAVAHNFEQKIIDPCCGAGTVVLEVLTVGGNIVGNELNPKVAWKANENLKHYGQKELVQTGDIQDVVGEYDVAILDLPYGHFSPISPEVQQMIINEARRLAKRLILVTQVDMEQELKQANFKLIDQCQVLKGKFVRYINICE